MTTPLIEAPCGRAIDSGLADDDEALDSSDIADLTDDSIRRMNCQEMARVVRAVKARHMRPGVNQSLTNYDAETLLRLVFLARRCCRHELACIKQTTHDRDHEWSGDWAD